LTDYRKIIEEKIDPDDDIEDIDFSDEEIFSKTKNKTNKNS